MSLQYLDTLKALGASPAIKSIFLKEFTNVLKPFIAYASESIEKPGGQQSRLR